MARDYYPRDLSSWRTIDSNSPVPGGQQKYNTGTEFSGRDAPKLKFLFTVSFELGNELMGRISSGSDEMGTNTYDCKTATRPTPNITYTDVMAYNYRFKIPTKTTMGTVTVSFYDDNKNTAHNLLQEYMNVISPITNKSREQYYADDNIQEWASMGGMMDSDIRGLIRSMRVTHHYNSEYNTNESSLKAIHYDYMNPQLQDFVWDELDMSQSDAAMVTATFVYDSVNIVKESNEERTPIVPVGELENI